MREVLRFFDDGGNAWDAETSCGYVYFRLQKLSGTISTSFSGCVADLRRDEVMRLLKRAGEEEYGPVS